MSALDQTKPSLGDAFARLDRAKDHLARVRTEIDSALKESMIIPWGLTGTFSISDYVFPKIVSILIGETTYNLRAALDYLVFELAYLDSGKIQKGTKFPIEDNEGGWQRLITPSSPGGRKRGRWPLWLPMLTPEHQAAIKRLQPCSGCSWTGTLRDVSNPDKHYRLVVATGEMSAHVTVNHSPENLTLGDIIESAVNVQGNITALVAFVDQAPVIETLETLIKEVSAVLIGFNSDFP